MDVKKSMRRQGAITTGLLQEDTEPKPSQSPLPQLEVNINLDLRYHQGRRVNYQEEDFPQVDDELSQAEADEDYEIDEEILHDDEIQFEEISSNNHYHGMVPADESSINNMMLNNKVIISPLNLKESHDHQQEDCCVVCLEQLAEVGSQVSQMPCSHQFHTACIQTWLNNSHYCPVCRYVMPAAQDS
ncbi:Zinc finger, RING-type [Corchorus capsularis]|uniref:RING-type E3 ubiquitin transferase n=1 Tax=Corchorus capsularis TaxID=210143 RepID=A0A1R3I4T2_COCAP|nr:Zinc finger, RING-type [Corchorus capsularis]